MPRLVHSYDIVPPLGKGEEKHQQEGHQHDPLAQTDVRGIAAGKDTEDKPEGNNTYVYDGISLQPEAVGNVQQPVAKYHAGRLSLMFIQEKG